MIENHGCPGTKPCQPCQEGRCTRCEGSVWDNDCNDFTPCVCWTVNHYA